MSYEITAAGSKRTPNEGCQELIEVVKKYFNLNRDDISYDDLINYVKEINKKYTVIVKKTDGEKIKFLIDETMTLGKFYDRLSDICNIPIRQKVVQLIHNHKHIPEWVPEKEHAPEFMIRAQNMPLIEVLDMTLSELLSKKIFLFVVPRQMYHSTGEYALCEANDIVFGPNRNYLTRNSFTTLLTDNQEINSLFSKLREAYAKDNDNIKVCPISFDVIGEKTTIGNKEFETFPFPHPKVETKTVGEQQEAKGRCIGYYSFAHLMKWMKYFTRWPRDNTEMSPEEKAFLKNLADYFYRNKEDPRLT